MIAHEMGLICVSLSVSLLPNVIVSLMAAQAMHSQSVSICWDYIIRSSTVMISIFVAV